jgi:hypothetical protein
MLYLSSPPKKNKIENKSYFYTLDTKEINQLIYNDKSVIDTLKGDDKEAIQSYKQECFKCQEIKPLNEFYEMHNRKTGYSRDCKECINADNKIKRAAKRALNKQVSC